MIREILEVAKKDLEGELTNEERAIGELLMFRILESINGHKTLTPLRVEYTIWFTEYQRDRAVASYHKLPKRDNEEHIYWK